MSFHCRFLPSLIHDLTFLHPLKVHMHNIMQGRRNQGARGLEPPCYLVAILLYILLLWRRTVLPCVRVHCAKWRIASLVPRPHPLFNVTHRKGETSTAPFQRVTLKSGCGLGTRLAYCHTYLYVPNLAYYVLHYNA